MTCPSVVLPPEEKTRIARILTEQKRILFRSRGKEEG